MSIQELELETDPEILGQASDLSPLWNGLALLLEATEFAQEVDRDVWDFAVEATALRRAGLSKSALRWLTCKGYVEHAREVTKRADDGRRFRPDGNLSFTRRSCLVLTDEGLQMVEALRERLEDADLALYDNLLRNRWADIAAAGGTVHPAKAQAAASRPNWDGQRHELRVGKQLIKIFKLPSPNQETVLMAFEEEGWPLRIDDPLPPLPNIHPKQRLHDTIKNLNRRQKRRLVRFMGDGTGQGVRWELISTGCPSES
jgi:hypothetical protein